MADMSILPTGEQYRISDGRAEAVICEQGATLRSLTIDGREVVAGFAATELPPACHGQHLLPWPNRIRDGRYVFDGETEQLPVNEVDRNNAIHGLVSWVPWRLVQQTDRQVVQSVTLLPRPGYPGAMEFTVSHTISDGGLVVEVEAVNVGASPAPLGYAAHPYFTLDAPIDEWTIDSPFAQYLEVDDRLLPIAVREVEGEKDFRGGRVLGGTQLDTAFCDPGTPGRWQLTCAAGDRSFTVWAGEGLGWLQVYTPDDRASLAIEPMTCGPDAFNEGPTHDGLLVVQPGQRWGGRWGVTA